MVPPARIKRTASSLPGTCTSAVLRRQDNSQTAGTNPAKNARCLKPPFAAPPRGPVPDQRAILCPCRDGHPEFKKRFTSSRDLTASAVVRGLSSVDVVEINLAGFGLGDPSARHNGAHEGEHDRREENLLAGAVLESCLGGAVAGHVALRLIGRGWIPAACYALPAILLVPRFSDFVR